MAASKASGTAAATTAAPSSPPSPCPRAGFRRRRDRFHRRAERLEARSRRFSALRLGVFLVLVAGLAAVLVDASRWAREGFAVAGGALAVFVVLARRHERVIRGRNAARAPADVNRRALDRLARRLAAAEPWPEEPDPPPPTARDLDLFGPSSLVRLLDTAATPPGRRRLVAWLREPATPAEIASRQQAVGELAPRLALRQGLERLGRAAGSTPGPGGLVAWAGSAPWLRPRRRLLLALRAATGLTVGSLAAALLGALPFHLPLLLLVLNLGVSRTLGSRHAVERFATIGRAEEGVAPYVPLFARLERLRPRSAFLTERRRALVEGGRPAHREMARLERLVELSHLRFSSAHGFVQALLLWDFHLLDAMERWQERCGARVAGWFDAWADLEAVAALAALAGEEPSWCLPTVDPAARRLTARALGHPLLPPGERVDNDLELGPPGTVLLLTGSNMSGKSTLLRAVGTNVALAQAGGPVCAGEMALPPVVLGTSVRVDDSLADGVSFFLAELERLRRIVELGERAGGGRRLLYLLDEVLRGTNPAQRRVAVARVLRRLLAAGALGMVTTHDLEIARQESLAGVLRPFHFRERLHPGGDPPMTFDYRLRPGLATTSNALELLRMLGLDEDGRGDGEPDASRDGHRGGRG